MGDFDAATITTTHGRDLVDEVVDDLYVRGFLDHDPVFPHAQARAIVELALNNPSAPIAAADDRFTVARARRAIAMRARETFEARKRRAAGLTYNDLITRLRAALEGPGGEQIAARLRRRFRVALIDEFQDTDPDQWEIVHRVFGGPDATLVLVGDPKQAVYAFRGADVYAYLAAARSAAARRELDTNWRSDQGLIEAYDALFANARLGHPEIVYRRVRAADPNVAPRLLDAPDAAPLRLRVVRRDLAAVGTTTKGYAQLNPSRAHVLADLVGEVVALLRSPAHIETRHQDGTPAGPAEPVAPSDLAVLVRDGFQARNVKAALDAAGVPAVVSGAGSVFAAEPARHWLRLLEALERPNIASRARSVALTPFLGWTAEQVADAGDDELDAVHRRLHRWAAVLRTKGVAALAETIMAREGVPARMLAGPDGERDLTDLRHTAELLHAAAIAGRLGTTALATWLRRRIADAGRDTDSDERMRRLQSDAAAVQVLTIHSSKGLEFPIVFLPYLWECRNYRDTAEPVAFHDAARQDARTLDVALEGTDYLIHRDRHRIEERGEELRLAYVALTRARHQAVVWWAGTWQGRDSVLDRLAFERAPDGTVPYQGGKPPSDATALARFGEIAGQAPGRVAVEAPGSPAPARWHARAQPVTDLEAARLERGIDLRWRRTSFSALSASEPDARVASEVEEATGADDRSTEAPVAAGPEPPDDHLRAELGAVPSLLATTPGGARVGTLVHAVLESADFSADDLQTELAGRIADARRRRSVDVGDPDTLVTGLAAALTTPLGPLAAGSELRDLAPADRLNELTFELPLVGGDAPAGELLLDALAETLAAELPAGDPLAAYAPRLADPALRRVLRGYLAGTVDLVARVADGASRPRFLVVDYKTNRLGSPGEPLTAWHHRPAALAATMMRDHYALQALLYSVALHRYLRWRLAVYDPEHDLGGVLYLFLRGMAGPSTPMVDGERCGVFAWRPPARLIERLSDLLDRGTSA
jgi:exodeoxyribonuclease V beta subunit